jgi:hypothetical protein
MIHDNVPFVVVLVVSLKVTTMITPERIIIVIIRTKKRTITVLSRLTPGKELYRNLFLHV